MIDIAARQAVRTVELKYSELSNQTFAVLRPKGSLGPVATSATPSVWAES